MSGIDIIFSRQFADPQNGAKLLVDISAGKIGAAAAAAEQSIAAENRILADQSDTAGRMSRSKHDPEDKRTNVNLIAFVIETGIVRSQIFIPCLHGIGCRIQLMDIKICAGLLDDCICRAGVIPVTVGNQDCTAGHLMLFKIV